MADEYPFWARWAKRVDGVIVPITDITTVSYIIQVYNPTTNVFDNVSSGTVTSADAQNRWIVPFSIPIVEGYKKYKCLFTPNGGVHQPLIDEIDVNDGSINGGGEQIGSGTESHSGTVCTQDGTPLENVQVRAVPYGTHYVFATTVTNSLGEYTISGLHVNHAYEIEFNKDGYWAKKSGAVIA